MDGHIITGGNCRRLLFLDDAASRGFDSCARNRWLHLLLLLLVQRRFSYFVRPSSLSMLVDVVYVSAKR